MANNNTDITFLPNTRSVISIDTLEYLGKNKVGLVSGTQVEVWNTLTQTLEKKIDNKIQVVRFDDDSYVVVDKDGSAHRLSLEDHRAICYWRLGGPSNTNRVSRYAGQLVHLFPNSRVTSRVNEDCKADLANTWPPSFEPKLPSQYDILTCSDMTGCILGRRRPGEKSLLHYDVVNKRSSFINITGPEKGIMNIRFHKNGSRWVAVGHEGFLVVSDPKLGHKRLSFTDHTETFDDAAFNYEGDKVFVITRSGRLLEVDWQQEKVVSDETVINGSGVSQLVAFYSDDNQRATQFVISRGSKLVVKREGQDYPQMLGGMVGINNRLAFSDDDVWLAVAQTGIFEDASVAIWDVEQLGLYASVTLKGARSVNAVVFFNEVNRLAVATDWGVFLIDILTKSIVDSVQLQHAAAVRKTKNGILIATAYVEDHFKRFSQPPDANGALYSYENKSLNKLFVTGWAESVTFGPGSQLAVGLWTPPVYGVNHSKGYSELALFDIDDKRETSRINQNFTAIEGVVYSNDGRQLIFSGEEKSRVLYVYDTKVKKVSLVESSRIFSSFGVDFSEDDKYLLSNGREGTLIWGFQPIDGVNGYYDYAIGQQWKVAGNYNSGVVYDAAFSNKKGHNYLAIAGSNSTVLKNRWNGKDVTLLSTVDGRWLVYNDSGYFDGSRDAENLASLVINSRSYSLKELGSLFNRPDLMLTEMRMGKSELIDYFAAQAEKRNQYFSVTGDSLIGHINNAPKISFGRSNTASKQLTVPFSINSSDQDTAVKYQVRVNGVDVFDAPKPINSTAFSTTEVITLSQGKNSIEVFAWSGNGVLGVSPKLEVEAESNDAPTLYYVGIGTNNYVDDYFKDLNYAERDVSQLGGLLKQSIENSAVSDGALYSDIKRLEILDDGRSKSEMLAEIRDHLSSANEDDVLVFFLAGHGSHSEGLYHYHLKSTVKSQLKNTSLLLDDISSLLAGSKLRNRVMLLDTCSSGESVSDHSDNLDVAILDITDDIQLDSRTSARGGVKRVRKEYEPAKLHNGDRLISYGATDFSGAIVFSSSLSGQRSLESSLYQHGFFTYAVLDALKGKADENNDGRINTKELFSYTSAEVGRMSKGWQNPTVDRDNIYLDISLPVLEGEQ